jgi:hypothetical protein
MRDAHQPLWFQYCNLTCISAAENVWLHGSRSAQAIIPNIMITAGTAVVSRAKTQLHLRSWLLGVLVHHHNRIITTHANTTGGLQSSPEASGSAPRIHSQSLTPLSRPKWFTSYGSVSYIPGTSRYAPMPVYHPHCSPPSQEAETYQHLVQREQAMRPRKEKRVSSH